ncbi:LiaF transmembrane domain-containing protein [Marinifilum flexuosum]|uniref:LiaF transmembrane domain-containing protein n=1 Tax=Marinifilum flexuosum TaxID=1117708 RepID=A0A419XB83_9BACT|nr:hypothetical protein [Marinifilum flexuosum]RKE04840.1 hypothetical protein BXY64_1871 [Marinifilum flexuosum]
MDEHRRNKSLFVGIGLIIVGVVVMLERLNFHSDFIWTWLYRWESILILVGLLSIVIKRKILGGFVAISVGAYFLLDEMIFMPVNWEIWFLPIALIVAGVAYIFQPVSKECKK